MCLYEVNNWEREVCIRKCVRCMGVCDGLGAWEVRSFHTIRSGIIIYFLLSFFANCTYPFNQDGGRERIQKAREWKRKGDTETVSESTCLGCVMMSRRQNKRNNWSHERKQGRRAVLHHFRAFHLASCKIFGKSQPLSNTSCQRNEVNEGTTVYFKDITLQYKAAWNCTRAQSLS